MIVTQISSQDSDLTCGSNGGGSSDTWHKHSGLNVCMKRFKLKIPRLLVHDIRKLYCAMIMNVFNSADFSMMFAFLDTYFVRNVQYRTSKFSIGSSSKDFSLNINGIFELTKYWFSILRMSPDIVMRLHDTCFDQSTGILHCVAKKECSHIYEFARNSSYYAPYLFVDKRYGREVLYANDASESDFVVGRRDRVESTVHVVTQNKVDLMHSIVESIDNVVDHLPLCQPPIVVKADGSFTIYTDENKLITRIEVCFSF